MAAGAPAAATVPVDCQAVGQTPPAPCALVTTVPSAARTKTRMRNPGYTTGATAPLRPLPPNEVQADSATPPLYSAVLTDPPGPTAKTCSPLREPTTDGVPTRSKSPRLFHRGSMPVCAFTHSSPSVLTAKNAVLPSGIRPATGGDARNPPSWFQPDQAGLPSSVWFLAHTLPLTF